MRVYEARRQWISRTQEAVQRAADTEQLQAIRDEAAGQLENMRQQIRELHAALRIDPGDIDLPPYDIPRAVLIGEPSEPLIDSRLQFGE
jgi:hypothetical protein